MPQRFLRPGIRTSPRWNAVSHEAARLYIAIITQVDDYGRYDGRNSILWSDGFAVWNEQHPTKQVTAEACVDLCNELEKARLIFFYEHECRRYCVINQWQERARGDSKWPPPPDNIEQELAKDRNKQQELFGMAQETAGNRSGKLLPSPAPSSLAIASGQALVIYEAYPKKQDRKEALRAIERALRKITFDELLKRTRQYAAAVSTWQPHEKRFVPLAATWCNKERYNDDPTTWRRDENTKQPASVRDGRIDSKFSQAGAYANAARTE